MTDGHGDEGLRGARLRKLAAHGVQARGPIRAIARHLGLLAEALGEPADDDRDHEEDGEGDHVTDVAHREGEAGANEEEIEGQAARGTRIRSTPRWRTEKIGRDGGRR